MKELKPCRLMRWMMDRGLPAHRAHDALGWMGGGSFWLMILLCILIDKLDSSGMPELLALVMLTAMIALLAFSGYCLWHANVLWIMLLLFGAGDVVMGLAISLGSTWRIIFCGLGLILLALGIFLAPRQLRRSRAWKPQLEQSRTDWQRQRREKSAEALVVTEGTVGPALPTPPVADPAEEPQPAEPAVPAAEDPRPESPSVPAAQDPRPESPAVPAAQEPRPAEPAVPAAQDPRPESPSVPAAEQPRPPLNLLEQPVLWSLSCCMPDADPVYLDAGCAEVFTQGLLASVRRDSLSSSLGIQTGIRRYGTPEDIRAFLTGCVHSGISTLRVNSGSPDMQEIPLAQVLECREEHLVDDRNRFLRCQLLLAKESAWTLSKQQDKKNLHARKIAEAMLTARLNGYRALGNALLYALVGDMPADDLCATRAALDQLAAWAPGSGFEDDPALQAPVISVPLTLGFVNHPGEEGDAGKGCLCVYTDLAQARKGQGIFREHGMDFAVAIVTYEEMMGQAAQCAGILVDIGAIGLEIPRADYGQVETVRKLKGPIVASIKDAEKPAAPPEEAPETQPVPAEDKAEDQPQPGPQLMQTATGGPWKQLDYRWPHRFGYDFMLQSAQWLMDHGLPAKTLTTAAITGAPETEHAQQLQEGLSLKECAGREAGVLSLGGFSESAHGMLKIVWFNQTDLVRVFIMDSAEQASADAFVSRLWEAEQKGFA
ncbi:MAG: hypothetical protein ACI4O7_10860 [Aristaeellaceae bacterium]